MYTLAHTTEETVKLRQHAGKWLRTLRENAKLSQRDLAKLTGIEYYTFISQIEAGRGRLPPAQYAVFAKAYGVPLREFARTLLRYYDPLNHYALFEHEEPGAAVEEAPRNDNRLSSENSSVTELAARIARLEMLLETKASE